jgi:hypothetical protein
MRTRVIIIDEPENIPVWVVGIPRTGEIIQCIEYGVKYKVYQVAYLADSDDVHLYCEKAVI